MPRSSRRRFLAVLGGLAAGAAAGAAVSRRSGVSTVARPLYAGSATSSVYRVIFSRPGTLARFPGTPSNVFGATSLPMAAVDRAVYFSTGHWAAVGDFDAAAVADGATTLERVGTYGGFALYRRATGHVAEERPGFVLPPNVAVRDGVAFWVTAGGTRTGRERLRSVVDAWRGAARRVIAADPAFGAVLDRLAGGSLGECVRSEWGATAPDSASIVARGRAISVREATTGVRAVLAFDAAGRIDRGRVRAFVGAVDRSLTGGDAASNGDGTAPAGEVSYDRDGRIVAARWRVPTDALRLVE